jgi:hypothetical protein
MVVLLLLIAVPAQAQMDYNTLPQVPGCSWYPNPNWPGIYDAWCGSDEMGWYQPYEWYKLTGIYPPDYGMTGG